ncbi:MAG: hypothetical protein ACPHOK_08055, partial [Akkermansiaceae bacterium]
EAELEKDLEEWFRAALILLVATANMEHLLFGWVPLDLLGDERWVGTFFRLLLVVGVIELMPDQALFSVLHSGPLNLPIGKRLFHDLWNNRAEWIKKIGSIHLNRSSPVLAMMSAISVANRMHLVLLLVGFATSLQLSNTLSLPSSLRLTKQETC